MNADSITRIAGLIGEAGRIQMLTALLDGNGHSASELAMAAAVSPQTASSHLSKLLSGGLVVSERNGRQRLFRLRNADVAVAVEALGALAQNSGIFAMPAIRFARTCYDHLAGVLAIATKGCATPPERPIQLVPNEVCVAAADNRSPTKRACLPMNFAGAVSCVPSSV